MSEANRVGPAGGSVHRGLARAEAVVAALPLTADERQFVMGLGQRLVDVAVDAHWKAIKRGERLGDPCVAAAAGYALAVLYEADPMDVEA